MSICCIDCGAKESNTNNLYWHFREAHGYRPDVCYEMIAESLRNHVGPYVDQVPAEMEPQFMCEACGKRVEDIRFADRHGC